MKMALESYTKPAMATLSATILTLSGLIALMAPSQSAAANIPVAVECALKVKYTVHTESPSIDAVRVYRCEGKVRAVSDVDASDVATRQVIFGLDSCPRLPSTVVFGGKEVTEVREYRGTRIKSHVFAGECSDCTMSPNTGVADPRLDSAHFDARFNVRALISAVQPAPDIYLPAGKGRLTLRSEQTDAIIARAGWAARKCSVTPTPPIFCGGIAGIQCPNGLTCVDYPDDDCDPGTGGADCIGICVAP